MCSGRAVNNAFKAAWRHWEHRVDLRDTQGVPKGYPRDQHRSNTMPARFVPETQAQMGIAGFRGKPLRLTLGRVGVRLPARHWVCGGEPGRTVEWPEVIGQATVSADGHFAFASGCRLRLNAERERAVLIQRSVSNSRYGYWPCPVRVGGGRPDRVAAEIGLG